MFEGIHLQQLWLRVPFGTRVLTHEPPCWRLVLRFAEAEMMGAGWRFGWWVSSYGTWKRMISNRRSIYLCIILYVYMALLYRWIIRNTFDITQDSTFLKGSKGVPMNQKKPSTWPRQAQPLVPPVLVQPPTTVYQAPRGRPRFGPASLKLQTWWKNLDSKRIRRVLI